MRQHIAILSFLLATLVSFGASAQTDARAQAKVHFKKGTELFESGDYSEALAQFQQGKAVLADPSFDYSIARCHWKMGDMEAAERHAVEAVSGFAEYGRPEPIALNQAHLIAFRRLAAAQKVADRMPEEPAVVVSAPVPNDQPETEGGTPVQTWIGGATAAVGVGLLAWWGVTELSLGATIDDYEAAASAGDARAWDALRGEVESTQTRARVLLFSGAGLTAVGGALLVWGLTSSGKDEGVAVRLMPTGAAVVWTY